MNVYKELKEIAILNDKIAQLRKQLNRKIDINGLILENARIVKEDDLCFDDIELIGNHYYLLQYKGRGRDDYYGFMWFATDVKDEYIEVPYLSLRKFK